MPESRFEERKTVGLVSRFEFREIRRAFAFFTAGFTFSGLGNHLANTAAARLFPSTRVNDVARRVLTLNLLFPITQSITFLSVMFWRDGNIKNAKTKVVKDLPQSYLISLFVLTPLSYMQGRFVTAYWRKYTSFIQGSKLLGLALTLSILEHVAFGSESTKPQLLNN